jgi:hypothetical protein
MFEGLDKEGGVERFPKLTAGEYLLEVIENKPHTTYDEDTALIRTFNILESEGEKAMPKGVVAGAKLIYLSDDMADKHVGDYVRALTGAGKVTSTLADKIFGPENPAKGQKVRVRITDEISKKKKPYLKYDWAYVAQ